MNYRHHYHAGNYADVFKHALLQLLVQGMQRKEKGFLYLDTHAGRGGYDLTTSGVLPDGRERAPEWPAGVGRLWEASPLPAVLEPFLAAIKSYHVRKTGDDAELSVYPGSPWIVQSALRPQDRSVLCELREDDAEALDFAFGAGQRVLVRKMDGYTALKAMLPPSEKRALVLIDPPFESAGEFADITAALAAAQRRFPSGTYAIWYPITERARCDRFIEDLALAPGAPPMLCAELQIASDSAQVRMKGCGLLVLNPPWQIDQVFRAVLPPLADLLKLDAGAASRVSWPVPER
ncbi:MAG: 23S rRNA (adenine(2030)-N(6))-methyltransferase RlmJ [Candidatus Didemnitutus sp.]|nr:23S rRNA (adenine(2030)-N(6))-methyltransferase RlmJ [Candidatus Didemnitutus sp.]